jgi:alpha-tubulin suppressor-like RCC1 family protein
VNNEGRVFVLGDMTVKGVNGSQAKTKNDIVELDLNNIKKISSGINYSIALDDEGKVYGWGNNTYGQLGTGSLKNAVEPLLIESLIR